MKLCNENCIARKYYYSIEKIVNIPAEIVCMEFLELSDLYQRMQTQDLITHIIYFHFYLPYFKLFLECLIWQTPFCRKKITFVTIYDTDNIVS